ncbi:hypothetical protein WJX72_010851 [[Myrmecia] bisecta]|uniref:Uncharacterized protein n=1 Tax=[Myrmecia] bisecta TaxID=41462 RepID=A0AAW1PK20_9CHLO
MNPDAPAFVPGSIKSPAKQASTLDAANKLDAEELQTINAWVELQAWLAELERDHCIELALRYADKKRIEEIHKRVGVSKPKPKARRTRSSSPLVKAS